MRGILHPFPVPDLHGHVRNIGKVPAVGESEWPEAPIMRPSKGMPRHRRKV